MGACMQYGHSYVRYIYYFDFESTTVAYTSGQLRIPRNPPGGVKFDAAV